jgi:hypothetical protein
MDILLPAEIGVAGVRDRSGRSYRSSGVAEWGTSEFG